MRLHSVTELAQVPSIGNSRGFVRPVVLLIDNYKSFADAVVESLVKRNYTVVTASNTEQAKEIIAGLFPSIVISDNGLSTSSGSEGMEFRRFMLSEERLKNIPFVLMSGQLIENNDPMLKELRINQFLSKPISIARLLNTIQTVLEQV